MSDDPAVESRKRKDPPHSPAPPVDDSTSEEDAEEPLVLRPDWRLDPEQSHSDWTIEVWLEGKLYSTHHVHKVFLSRMSGYFETLFGGSKSFAETQTSTSRVELQQEMAATAFPVMLDFIYSLWDDSNPPITHQNCTALYFLGQYFEIRALRKKARHFRNQNMTPDHFSVYYEHSIAFHDQSTRNLLVTECACNTRAVFLYSGDDFFQMTDAKFWIDVLKQENSSGVANPKLSACIERFCRNHEPELTSELFRKFTDESVLPEVCFSSSCGLMKLEKSLVPSRNGSTELTSLQLRCVKAIVSKWVDLYHDDMEDILLEIGLHVYRKVMREIVSVAQSKAEDLEALKEKLPRAVVVTCSGDYGFKGCYILQDNLREGAPKYSMTVDQSDADGKGRTETWEISFCLEEDGPCWFLSKLGDVEQFYYYNDELVKEHGLILPPRGGWKRAMHEHVPVLRHPGLELKFKYELSDAED